MTALWRERTSAVSRGDSDFYETSWEDARGSSLDDKDALVSPFPLHRYRLHFALASGAALALGALAILRLRRKSRA